MYINMPRVYIMYVAHLYYIISHLNMKSVYIRYIIILIPSEARFLLVL